MSLAVDRPIINSPFREPDTYWLYEQDTGLPRQAPGRRPAGYYYRDPARARQSSAQMSLLADEHFVAIRQVEMKGVDLSQFQFDYDLNWAAMFLNADGTVTWVSGNLGDIPTVPLEYRTYTALGWTIEASEAGTRFTNDGTGHGMFVRIEGVETY